MQAARVLTEPPHHLQGPGLLPLQHAPGTVLATRETAVNQTRAPSEPVCFSPSAPRTFGADGSLPWGPCAQCGMRSSCPASTHSMPVAFPTPLVTADGNVCRQCHTSPGKKNRPSLENLCHRRERQ